MPRIQLPPHPMPDGIPLKRGDVVYALRDLSHIAPGIPAGSQGVVFEEGNAYGDGFGPMVRFYGGQMGNVYAGDVTKSREEADELIRLARSILDAEQYLGVGNDDGLVAFYRGKLKAAIAARPELKAKLKAAQKAYDAALKKYTK